VESTRQTILNILRRRHATVDDLTKELGLAPATVRRHLDILIRDSYVDVTQVRRQTGRPHFLYSMSEAGEDLFPKHYIRITNRLLEEIVALTPEETSGRAGGQLAELVFDKMAQRLSQRIAPHVHGGSLGERVRTATEALAEEGIVFDVEPEGEGFLLIGHGCPCPRVAETNGHICAHDQRLLGLLLGADVDYVEPGETSPHQYCAYRVQERANGAVAT
jgi:predicted ArsR family transcriptional regulator